MKLKELLIAIACIFCFQQTEAQTDTLPIYKRFPEVPPFSIIKVPDSTRFTKEDLNARKSTIIMLFSPDCDHCQHAIKELLANIGLFKKAQIVLASPLDFNILKKFYVEYKIKDYPNISVGRDLTYFFGSFYTVNNFPAIYIYNKQGKLSEEFSGKLDIKKAVAAL